MAGDKVQLDLEYLFTAVVCDSPQKCGELLTCLKDVNLMNSEGVTLLNVAIQTGSVEWVKKLLEMGANPDLMGKDHMTGLQVAELMKTKFENDADRRVILEIVGLVTKREAVKHSHAKESKVYSIGKMSTETSTETSSYFDRVESIFHSLIKELDSLKTCIRNARAEISILASIEDFLSTQESIKKSIGRLNGDTKNDPSGNITWTDGKKSISGETVKKELNVDTCSANAIKCMLPDNNPEVEDCYSNKVQEVESVQQPIQDNCEENVNKELTVGLRAASKGACEGTASVSNTGLIAANIDEGLTADLNTVIGNSDGFEIDAPKSNVEWPLKCQPLEETGLTVLSHNNELKDLEEDSIIDLLQGPMIGKEIMKYESDIVDRTDKGVDCKTATLSPELKEKLKGRLPNANASPRKGRLPNANASPRKTKKTHKALKKEWQDMVDTHVLKQCQGDMSQCEPERTDIQKGQRGGTKFIAAYPSKAEFMSESKEKSRHESQKKIVGEEKVNLAHSQSSLKVEHWRGCGSTRSPKSKVVSRSVKCLEEDLTIQCNDHVKGNAECEPKKNAVEMEVASGVNKAEFFRGSNEKQLEHKPRISGWRIEEMSLAHSNLGATSEEWTGCMSPGDPGSFVGADSDKYVDEELTIPCDGNMKKVEECYAKRTTNETCKSPGIQYNSMQGSNSEIASGSSGRQLLNNPETLTEKGEKEDNSRFIPRSKVKEWRNSRSALNLGSQLHSFKGLIEEFHIQYDEYVKEYCVCKPEKNEVARGISAEVDKIEMVSHNHEKHFEDKPTISNGGNEIMTMNLAVSNLKATTEKMAGLKRTGESRSKVAVDSDQCVDQGFIEYDGHVKSNGKCEPKRNAFEVNMATEVVKADLVVPSAEKHLEDELTISSDRNKKTNLAQSNLSYTAEKQTGQEEPGDPGTEVEVDSDECVDGELTSPCNAFMKEDGKCVPRRNAVKEDTAKGVKKIDLVSGEKPGDPVSKVSVNFDECIGQGFTEKCGGLMKEDSKCGPKGNEVDINIATEVSKADLVGSSSEKHLEDAPTISSGGNKRMNLVHSKLRATAEEWTGCKKTRDTGSNVPVNSDEFVGRGFTEKCDGLVKEDSKSGPKGNEVDINIATEVSKADLVGSSSEKHLEDAPAISSGGNERMNLVHSKLRATAEEWTGRKKTGDTGSNVPVNSDEFVGQGFTEKCDGLVKEDSKSGPKGNEVDINIATEVSKADLVGSSSEKHLEDTPAISSGGNERMNLVHSKLRATAEEWTGRKKTGDTGSNVPVNSDEFVGQGFTEKCDGLVKEDSKSGPNGNEVDINIATEVVKADLAGSSEKHLEDAPAISSGGNERMNLVHSKLRATAEEWAGRKRTGDTGSNVPVNSDEFVGQGFTEKCDGLVKEDSKSGPKGNEVDINIATEVSKADLVGSSSEKHLEDTPAISSGGNERMNLVHSKLRATAEEWTGRKKTGDTGSNVPVNSDEFVGQGFTEKCDGLVKEDSKSGPNGNEVDINIATEVVKADLVGSSEKHLEDAPAISSGGNERMNLVHSKLRATAEEWAGRKRTGDTGSNVPVSSEKHLKDKPTISSGGNESTNSALSNLWATVKEWTGYTQPGSTGSKVPVDSVMQPNEEITNLNDGHVKELGECHTERTANVTYQSSSLKYVKQVSNCEIVGESGGEHLDSISKTQIPMTDKVNLPPPIPNLIGEPWRGSRSSLKPESEVKNNLDRCVEKLSTEEYNDPMNADGEIYTDESAIHEDLMADQECCEYSNLESTSFKKSIKPIEDLNVCCKIDSICSVSTDLAADKSIGLMMADMDLTAQNDINSTGLSVFSHSFRKVKKTGKNQSGSMLGAHTKRGELGAQAKRGKSNNSTNDQSKVSESMNGSMLGAHTKRGELGAQAKRGKSNNSTNDQSKVSESMNESMDVVCNEAAFQCNQITPTDLENGNAKGTNAAGGPYLMDGKKSNASEMAKQIFSAMVPGSSGGASEEFELELQDLSLRRESIDRTKGGKCRDHLRVKDAVCVKDVNEGKGKAEGVVSVKRQSLGGPLKVSVSVDNSMKQIVDAMMAKTMIVQRNAVKISLVRSFYEKLYSRSSITLTLLNFLRFQPAVQIYIDTESETIEQMIKKLPLLSGGVRNCSGQRIYTDLSEKRIFLGAQVAKHNNVEHVIGFLANSLCLMSVSLAFGNKGRPYLKEDREKQAQFVKIIANANVNKRQGKKLMKYIKSALDQRTLIERERAIIGVLSQIIYIYGLQESTAIFNRQLESALPFLENQVMSTLSRECEIRMSE